MTPINSCVVQTMDGRVGVLIARYELQGHVIMGAKQTYYPLTHLNYHLTAPPDSYGPRQINKV